jgi:hypothetical protein
VATRTLAQLRADVRQTVDLINNTSWITDAEINRRLNESLSRLHGIIVQARGEEYFRKLVTAVTVADVATVAQPADLLSLLAIDIVLGSETMTARRIGFEHRNSFEDTAGWSTNISIFYSLEAGPVFRFFPTPQSVFTINIWYIQGFTNLVGDVDTFEGFNNWEHWAVVDAAIQILAREESDTQALAFERNRIEAEIEALAPNRDRGEPRTVTDVRRERFRNRGWREWWR